MLILIVFLVPLLMHPASRNMMDLKDFTLGLGVVAGLALVLFGSLARGSLSYSSARLNAFVGAYLAWAVISLLYSHYRYATISEASKLAAHVGLFLLVILSVRDMGQVRRIIGAAALAAVAVCIYGFMQALGKDPIPWNVPLTRVFSSLGNATYLAGYLVLLLPLVVAAAWPKRRGIEEQKNRNGRQAALPIYLSTSGFAIVAVMMFITLLLTVSLSPLIGLVLGAGIAALLVLLRVVYLSDDTRRALRVLIPAIAIGIILFIVLGYLWYLRLPPVQQARVVQVLHLRDPYGHERESIQRVGFDIFRTQPAVGKGYGTYAIFALERLAPAWYAELGNSTNTMLIPNYAHNEFIEVLAETGLVGVLLFIALITTAFAGAITVSLRHPDQEWRRLALAITVGMTAFLFQNWFGITFRLTGSVTFFWLSLGLLTVAQSSMRAGQADILQPGLREFRFRVPSRPALAAVGIGLAVVVGTVAWLAWRPVQSNVLIKQAEREAKQGRFQTAGQLADEAAALNPYSTHAYYISAYAWGSLGDHQRSVEANRKSLALLPGNASVYYNLGVNYKNLGRLEEARESFDHAIKLMPTAMRHYAAMAEVLMDMQRYDEALTYAKEAARLEPGNAEVRLLLADIYARKGDGAASATQMDEVARLAPGDASVLGQLGRLYFKLRDYPRAMKVCEQWLGVDPNAPDAYGIIGSVHYHQQDYAGALAAFKRLVELDPGNASGRLQLAYAYAHLGDYVSAQQELTWLATNRPDTPEGQKAAEALRAGAEAMRQRSPANAGAPGAR